MNPHDEAQVSAFGGSEYEEEKALADFDPPECEFCGCLIGPMSGHSEDCASIARETVRRLRSSDKFDRGRLPYDEDPRSKKPSDPFPVGTVIRWTSSGKYTYAALKTPVGWYSTAKTGNAHVNPILSYETLVEVLSRRESSNIEVATGWSEMPI